MKKILLPMFALVLAIGLALPMAAPVAAASTTDYYSSTSDNVVIATGGTTEGTMVWGTSKSAVATWVHSAWESVKLSYTALGPATWISSAEHVEDAVHDSWRKFTRDFTVPPGATNISGTLLITADNAYKAYLTTTSGTTAIGSDGIVWGDSDGKHYWPTAESYPIYPEVGSNTLEVVVRNWSQSGGTWSTNPTGLIYKLTVEYEEVVVQEEPEIGITKSGPDYAHVGDNITYNYTLTNTGNCALLDVSLVDDVVGSITLTGLTDEDDDLLEDDLAVGASATGTASYVVPSGADPVENTATASGTSPEGTLVESDPADWSVDVLNPDIAVVKSGPVAAAPGETVTYTYTVKNTGDCILYDVSLLDDVVGPIILIGLTDEDGDTFADDLAVNATATGSAEYTVGFGDPEWLENIAAAEGTDELGLTVYDDDSWTIHTMGARTIGYWKTHPEAWADWVPAEGSIFYACYNATAGVDQDELLSYLPRNDRELKKMNQLEMLRAQLLGAELNIYYFDDEFDYSRYEATDIYVTIAAAEAFLKGLPDDLDAYWSSLSKVEQRVLKEAIEPLKDALDEFNNIGDEIFE